MTADWSSAISACLSGFLAFQLTIQSLHTGQFIMPGLLHATAMERVLSMSSSFVFVGKLTRPGSNFMSIGLPLPVRGTSKPAPGTTALEALRVVA
jgi:hypothetical protein